MISKSRDQRVAVPSSIPTSPRPILTSSTSQGAETVGPSRQCGLCRHPRKDKGCPHKMPEARQGGAPVLLLGYQPGTGGNSVGVCGAALILGQ